jgi:hypothetical protein
MTPLMVSAEGNNLGRMQAKFIHTGYRGDTL